MESVIQRDNREPWRQARLRITASLALGKGGKTFLKKSFLPSPNPIPPFPKTFVFIESLFGIFP